MSRPTCRCGWCSASRKPTKSADSFAISGRRGPTAPPSPSNPLKPPNRETVMPQGIRDKVAILGMGCSKFGERWDAGPDDLMVEAYLEAMQDAGIEPTQLDAAWFSTHIDEIGTGKGGTPLSIALRLPNIAVTRVENFCASGSEAVRGAGYAVAGGAGGIALA